MFYAKCMLCICAIFEAQSEGRGRSFYAGLVKVYMQPVWHTADMAVLSYVVQLFNVLSGSAACRAEHCVILTLGLSVVPLVYMMVHRSSGLGGMGSEGFSCPSFAKASKLNTLMPKASVSCTASFHLSCCADDCPCDCSGWCPRSCIRLVIPACMTFVA